MMTLRERCLSLPYKDRLTLCETIKNSILRDRNEMRMGRRLTESRGEILLGYMAEILGEPVPAKSRETRFVWARSMVAYQLIREGFNTIETGRMIGKDHSTITHMKTKVQDALEYTYAYRDIVDIWKQFQTRIDNENHRGTTQDIICLGGEFPDCGQQEMVK